MTNWSSEFNEISIQFFTAYDFCEVILVYESIWAFGIMFGEHFYCCGEFFVKPGYEIIQAVWFGIEELDLIGV